MAQPDIIAIERVGSGYLSTTFNDPTDLAIIHRKWIFGDGVVIEGSGLATINHTYYSPGEYSVVLVAQTITEQITVKKDAYIIVDKLVPAPQFIIAQSFNTVSGEYWRFYFDQQLFLIFEDNNYIYRSRYRVAEINKWMFVDFHRQTGKMSVGSFSYFIKELEVVKLENTNPVIFLGVGTEILPNSSMKLDELRIWSMEKDTKSYYVNNRGMAGHLDTLI